MTPSLLGPTLFNMPNVVTEVPIALQPAVDAALAWVRQNRGESFELTGLVDPQDALAKSPGDPVELGLVLCDGEAFVRTQLGVRPDETGFQVTPLEGDGHIIPPELDPPAGIRTGWLDAELARHAFVVVLFYRGFW